MGHKILVVDDEQDFLDSVKRGLITAGYKNVHLASDPREAAAMVERGEDYDVVLIDITMPYLNGMQLLEKIKYHSPNTECIMITAVNEAKVAVECLKKGAYDYLVKPISRDDLLLRIHHALERKRLIDVMDLRKEETFPQLTHAQAFTPIVTRSENVLKILKEAELHAVSNVPILVTGESGTGKELLAKAIHRVSPRAKQPFTPVNMASLTPGLFDAEFFGHTKGAFTGAEKDRKGYLEHTNRGTLFLDEIGSLPLDLQGKLLRVLQEGAFMKLGSSETQTADIRFIAATNQNLEKLVAKGVFRKDLYYRLRGAWLHLPPLRQRQEDIPLLVDKFLREFQSPNGDPNIDEDAVLLLMDYDYPGNIRELRSIIHAAVNLAGGRSISARFLPNYLRSRNSAPKSKPQGAEMPVVSLAEVEKDHILNTYERTSRNKSQTARLLGIGINTLRRKLETYGIE